MVFEGAIESAVRYAAMASSYRPSCIRTTPRFERASTFAGCASRNRRYSAAAASKSPAFCSAAASLNEGSCAAAGLALVIIPATSARRNSHRVNMTPPMIADGAFLEQRKAPARSKVQLERELNDTPAVLPVLRKHTKVGIRHDAMVVGEPQVGAVVEESLRVVEDVG